MRRFVRMLVPGGTLAALVIGAAPPPVVADEWDVHRVRFGGEGQRLAVSADGERILIATDAQLAPGDHDQLTDLYLLEGGEARLVSGETPPAPADPDQPVFDAMSRDGSTVIFETRDRLVPADTGSITDIYAWTDGNLAILTGGAGGWAGGGAPNAMVSDSARQVLSWTAASLTPDDADSAVDAYEWNDGTLQLLSRPDWAAPAEPLWSAYPVAITRDGTRAVFVTAEKLTDDPDRWGSENLYARDAGGLRLITRRPAGVDVGQTALFIGQGFSPDGSHFYFLTERSLVPEDTDSLDFDLYAYSFLDGSTRLISGTSLAPPGPTSSTPQVRATSTDGSTVVFSTDESLLPADQNSEVDVYVSRRGAGLRLLTARSPALGGGAVGTNTYERVAAVDPGAQRILFTSTIPLLPEDQGGQGDLYAWNDGILSAIAPAPVRADERSRLYVTGTSADLRRIFLSTRQNLTADDPPGMDLFEWRGGAVQRLPLGAGQLGVGVADVLMDGQRIVVGTSRSVEASDTNGSYDLYVLDRRPPRESGPAPPPGGPPSGRTVDRTPPRLARLAVRTRLALGRDRPGFARRLEPAWLAGTLSEAGRIVLRFTRILPGQRVGARCVSPRAGRVRRCWRQRPAGLVALAAPAGTVRIRFSGRLSARAFLAPGSYRVRVVVTDAAGNASAQQTRSFRVTPSSHVRLHAPHPRGRLP